MSNQHLVGIFSDRSKADHVLSELNAAGFSADEVSVIAKDHEDEDLVRMYSATTYPDRPVTTDKPVVSYMDNEYIKQGHNISDKDPVSMQKGAAAGTLFGTAIGLGSLMIPGIGPVLAGGAIASAIATTSAWAAAGTTIGMLVGLVKDIHIPEERNAYYKAAFEKGQFIIIVHPETDPASRIGTVKDIFNRFAPEVIDAY